MKTVRVDESELQSKLNELVSILNGLNVVLGLTNLTSLIHDAKHMDTDDELKKQLNKTLKEWEDMDTILDRDFEELKLGQSHIRQDLSDIKDDQREGKEVQCEIRDDVRRLDKRVANIEQELPNQRLKSELSDSDVKECLMKSYLESCDKLKVSPLFNEDDEMDLLTIYQPPNMCHLPYHRDRQTEGQYPLSSYEDVFTKDGKSFRNIYITGDAGVGKSSFCQRMALLWSKSQSGDIIDNEDVKRDIDFLRTFDFVFYVSLRDSHQVDIVEMIIDRFFYTNSKVKREEIITLIEDILRVKRCLIILDGFDEWTPTTTGNETCKLPRKIKSETCTFITSCRPYKIESVRLDKKDIDRQIQISGICEKSTEKYVEKIVDYVNKVNNSNKKPSNFLSEVRKCALEDQLCIPIISSQLVMLWFDKGLTDMSRAVLYGNIIEMMFERTVKEKGIESTSATAVEIKLPESFAEFTYLQMYASLLEKVCSLSFRSLFQLDKRASGLVFTEKQLMSYSITSEEINTLCKLGILSKSKVVGSFARKELMISFIHISYTEFLAVLFIYSFDKNNSLDTIINTWNSVKDIVQYKNFFIFLTGISYDKVKSLLEKISSKISEELVYYRYDLSLSYLPGKVRFYQDLVLSCYKETCRSKTSNLVLKLEHFWFDFEDILLLRLLELNRMCVKSIHLFASVFSHAKDVLNCIKDSQLEHLYISGLFGQKIGYSTLAYTIKTLPCIRSITLLSIELSDDVFLQLHPVVTQVEIKLLGATMNRQSFNCFIESCVNNKSEIKVVLIFCKITSVDGETRTELSYDQSMTYMTEYLESITTINIKHKHGSRLHFVTTSFKQMF